MSYEEESRDWWERGQQRMTDKDELAGRIGQYLAWHAQHQQEAHGTVSHEEYWKVVASGVLDGMAISGWVMVPSTKEAQIAHYSEVLRWLTEPDNWALMWSYEPELMERLMRALEIEKEGEQGGSRDET